MDKESVIITGNNYSKRKSFVVSFSVGHQVFSFRMPTEFIQLYEMFKELARREGISKSQLIVKAICEYVHHHYPGNPQLPLTRFTITETRITAPKPVKVYIKKEKAREMLAFALKHVGELPPHSREYYFRLARENQDFEEALQLIKALSEKDSTEGES